MVVIQYTVNVLKFLTLFMLVFRAGIHKFLVRIANREETDQTASSEAVWSGSALFVYAFLAGIWEHLLYFSCCCFFRSRILTTTLPKSCLGSPRWNMSIILDQNIQPMILCHFSYFVACWFFFFKFGDRTFFSGLTWTKLFAKLSGKLLVGKE